MRRRLKILIFLLAGTAAYTILGYIDPAMGEGASCGKKYFQIEFYENMSLYSLIIGFVLVFSGILLDKKKIKACLFVLAVVPFGAWIYVHYVVEFDQLKQVVFNYNVAAENALANIAEAQDRIKSEQDTYLQDLNKLYSHTAGSHGVDPCVKIIKLEATWNTWYAEARHVSSPNKITWDSQRGSSLKKG